MVKKVRKLALLDLDTGEVIAPIRGMQKVNNQGSVYIYNAGFEYMLDMPYQCYRLLFSLLKRMSYAGKENGMCVILNEAERAVIRFELGWESDSTLRKVLSRLVDGKILFRVSKGIYKFNPWLFGKGSSYSVAEMRKDIPQYLTIGTFSKNKQNAGEV